MFQPHQLLNLWWCSQQLLLFISVRPLCCILKMHNQQEKKSTFVYFIHPQYAVALALTSSDVGPLNDWAVPVMLASLSVKLMSECSSVWLNPKSALLHLLPWKRPTGVAEDDQHCIFGRKLWNFKILLNVQHTLIYWKCCIDLIPCGLLFFHNVIYYSKAALSAIGIISGHVVVIIHLMSAWASRHL